MIFMKMQLILNSFEVPCDKNPLFKIQSVLCGRLAINHSAEQFGCHSQLLCNRPHGSGKLHQLLENPTCTPRPTVYSLQIRPVLILP